MKSDKNTKSKYQWLKIINRKWKRNVLSKGKEIQDKEETMTEERGDWRNERIIDASKTI